MFVEPAARYGGFDAVCGSLAPFAEWPLGSSRISPASARSVTQATCDRGERVRRQVHGLIGLR